MGHRVGVLELLRVQLRFGEQLGHADDRVERRAQLVAHRGEEIGFRARCLHRVFEREPHEVFATRELLRHLSEAAVERRQFIGGADVGQRLLAGGDPLHVTLQQREPLDEIARQEPSDEQRDEQRDRHGESQRDVDHVQEVAHFGEALVAHRTLIVDEHVAERAKVVHDLFVTWSFHRGDGGFVLARLLQPDVDRVGDDLLRRQLRHDDGPLLLVGEVFGEVDQLARRPMIRDDRVFVGYEEARVIGQKKAARRRFGIEQRVVLLGRAHEDRIRLVRQRGGLRSLHLNDREHRDEGRQHCKRQRDQDDEPIPDAQLHTPRLDVPERLAPFGDHFRNCRS